MLGAITRSTVKMNKNNEKMSKNSFCWPNLSVMLNLFKGFVLANEIES